MAPDVPLRSARLPSPPEVIELLSDEFASGGYEIEDVVIESTSRPPRIVIVADGDQGLDLESLAALSRSASDLLDRSASADAVPYLLEVTSRGVDRPLTSHRHYRRARGRKIEFEMSDGALLTGRLGELDGDVVALVVDDGGRGKYAIRQVALGDVARAVVQVEFSQANRRELELAGLSPEEFNQ